MKNSLHKKKSFLKKALAIASLGIFAAPVLALSPPALPIWSIQDGKLLDPNGKPFVFRGVTIEHTLATPEKTLQALKDIAAHGANSAQIEFPLKSDGNYPRQITIQVRDIIQTCKDSKLVCVLEPNDGSGYSEVFNAVSPTVMASLWGWGGMRDALSGAQSHIIIGLSNQPLGSIYYSSFDYRIRMDQYVSELRSALPQGFLIMVDGNKWGQDTDKAMLEFATINKSQNRYPNLIYSIDMFDAYTDPTKVRDYIASFAQLQAPLIIGGFGPTPYYHPHNIAVRPTVPVMLPAQSVMEYAEEFATGSFAWSWSGNLNGGLDLVTNWDASALTPWGNLAFNGAHGIKATAKPASIYVDSSSSSSATSSSAPANQPPVALFQAFNSYGGLCGKGSITATANGSYDPDGDDLTYSWRLSENGANAYVATGYSATFESRSGVRYQLALTVTDSKGASADLTKNIDPIYIDCVSSASSSVRSSVPSSHSSADVVSSRSSSSSSAVTPSSISSSSRSSISSSRSSSSAIAVNNCSYVIQSQWNTGFTAVVRIKNNRTQPINGWSVNWQYGDGSRITNLWNASLTGSNPYSAKNLSWNSTIQPGQTLEFGFQGSKAAGSASIPVVTGSVCQ